MLGRRVARLMDSVQSEGAHEALFEAGSLPSGVYLYRVTARGQSRAGSLLLVK